MILIIFVTLVLGLNSATKAFYSSFLPEATPSKYILLAIAIVSGLISVWVWVKGKRGLKIFSRKTEE
jgi:hypothetical protein